MAENNPAKAAPAATKAAPARATMAPAARAPEGDDDRGSWLNRSLQGVSEGDLQTLRNRVDAELRRRATHPTEPSFGISEGTRVELEQREQAPDPSKVVVTSPFTGAELDGDGKPVEAKADDEKQ